MYKHINPCNPEKGKKGGKMLKRLKYYTPMQMVYEAK
jgi:hypothetical protein